MFVPIGDKQGQNNLQNQQVLSISLCLLSLLTIPSDSHWGSWAFVKQVLCSHARSRVENRSGPWQKHVRARKEFCFVHHCPPAPPASHRGSVQLHRMLNRAADSPGYLHKDDSDLLSSLPTVLCVWFRWTAGVAVWQNNQHLCKYLAKLSTVSKGHCCLCDFNSKLFLM